MRRAILFRYSLPLDAGNVLRRQRPAQREGFVLRLERDGGVGEGEIAPLPGFSRENPEQAANAALTLLRYWVAGQDILPPPSQLHGQPVPAPAQRSRWRSSPRSDLSDAALTLESLPPSAAFGISCALAELDGRLPDRADYQTVPLCHGEPAMLIPRLAALPGRKTAKIKVGLTEPRHDSRLVNTLLAEVPDLHLRLDANRSWSAVDAAAFAAGLDPAIGGRIDFIEEPCAAPADSLAFAQRTGLAIAWDESVREADFRISPQPGVAAIIIKPTLTGSLAYCAGLIAQARQAGLSAVISSSVESSLGLTQLARLAGWLTPGVVPGLDTLSLMGAQLLRPWPGSSLPLQSPALLNLTAQLP